MIDIKKYEELSEVFSNYSVEKVKQDMVYKYLNETKYESSSIIYMIIWDWWCNENVEDVYDLIKDMLQALDFDNKIVTEYVIKSYAVNGGICSSLEGYNILFQLKTEDILKIVSKLGINETYIAYGVLAVNEGGRYIELYQDEFMNMLNQRVFRDVDSTYYNDFSEYIKGHKRLIDIKTIDSDNINKGIREICTTYAMLIKNDCDVSRKIIAYFLYSESSFTFMARCKLMREIVIFIGVDKVITTIENVDDSGYMLFKVIMNYKYSSDITPFIKGDNGYEEEKITKVISRCIEIGIKTIIERAFEKEEFVSEELEILLKIIKQLYEEDKISKEDYAKVLLKTGNSTRKSIREYTLYNCLYEVNEEYITLAFLGNKKATIRMLGVDVCKKKRNRTPAIMDKLKDMMDKDRSKKVRDIIADILGYKLEASQSEKKIFDKALTKRTVNKFSWLNIEGMIKLKDKKGKELGDEYGYKILYEYSKKMVEVNNVEEDIKEAVDSESLAIFVYQVLEKWIDQNAIEKNRWVLYLVGDFGGQDTIKLLEKWIKKWSKNRRMSIAHDGLYAISFIALRGSHQALVVLDSITRKSKYPTIKQLGEEYMSLMAKRLKITREDLNDRLIFNLGFDEYENY